MDIEVVLQNLVVILNCLNDEMSINWATKELSGYNKDDSLPKYRTLSLITKTWYTYKGYSKY
ncbi:hypothetical protein IC213_12220 [Clostridioides sp. ES-S-0049-02]|uniref:AbiTii domain-containing protein n=1 Tax=Clostridioides sp. ES-S-0049-02 TaxID=2770778 RepID=UPI001DA3080B|nr:hypothetical protein [Clostridioides sp. ES-S-0049-02]